MLPWQLSPVLAGTDAPAGCCEFLPAPSVTPAVAVADSGHQRVSSRLALGRWLGPGSASGMTSHRLPERAVSGRDRVPCLCCRSQGASAPHCTLRAATGTLPAAAPRCTEPSACCCQRAAHCTLLPARCPLRAPARALPAPHCCTLCLRVAPCAPRAAHASPSCPVPGPRHPRAHLPWHPACFTPQQVGHRGRRRGLRFAGRGWRGEPPQPAPSTWAGGASGWIRGAAAPRAPAACEAPSVPLSSPQPQSAAPLPAHPRPWHPWRPWHPRHPRRAPAARLTPAALPPLPGCFSAAGNGPFPEGFCARDCRGRWAGQGAGHPRRCVLPAARLPGAGGALALPRACRGSRDLSFFLLPRHPSPEEKRVGKK